MAEKSNKNLNILTILSFGILGFTTLIFQIVFAKNLVLLFGLTAPAIATVITIFFSGIAIGSFLFGKLVDRFENRAYPLYASIFFFTGIYCFFVPHLFPILNKIILAINQSHPLNFSGFNFLTFLLSFLFLILPTIFIGGGFPVVSKILIKQNEILGKKISFLYFVNTFGGVAGVFLAGFWLIPNFGNNATIISASILNLIIAVLIFVFFKSKNFETAQITESQKETLPDNKTFGNKLFFYILFVTGFLSLALEVLYTKTLILFVGSSTYAFSLILIIFLLGIALGSAVASIFIDKIKKGFAYLGIFFGLLGFWLFLALNFFDNLSFWYLKIFQLFDSLNFSAILFTQFLLIFLVIFPSTFLMGIIFVLGIKLANPNQKKLGDSIGKLYFANTVGGVLGSLLIGFLAMPSLGYQKTLICIILAYFALGIFFIFKEKEIDRLIKWPLLFFLLLWCAFAIFSSPWSRGFLTLGSFIYAPNYVNLDEDVLKRGSEIDKTLFYSEGLSNITVIQRGSGLFLRVNGKTDASNNLDDLEHEILIGALPMIFHAEPRDVLVVGLGSGITLGAVTQFDNAQNIEMVEIDPAIVQAAEYFKEDNHNALHDSRVKIITADGRNYLSLTEKKYDVISSQPSNLWVSGNAYLFTKEYYQLTKAHLKENGLMAQWIQAYSLDPEDLKAVLKTFQEVFPNVYLFDSINSGDLFLIGSLEKESILNFANLDKKFSDIKIKRELERIYINNPYELLAYFSAGGDSLKKFSENALTHTDNRTFLEFSSPKTLYKNTAPLMAENISVLRSNANFNDFIVGGENSLLEKYFKFRKELIPTQIALRNGDLMVAIDSYKKAKQTGLTQLILEADFLKRCNLAAIIAQQDKGSQEAERVWNKCGEVFNETEVKKE